MDRLLPLLLLVFTVVALPHYDKNLKEIKNLPLRLETLLGAGQSKGKELNSNEIRVRQFLSALMPLGAIKEVLENPEVDPIDGIINYSNEVFKDEPVHIGYLYFASIHNLLRPDNPDRSPAIKAGIGSEGRKYLEEALKILVKEPNLRQTLTKLRDEYVSLPEEVQSAFLNGLEIAIRIAYEPPKKVKGGLLNAATIVGGAANSVGEAGKNVVGALIG